MLLKVKKLMAILAIFILMIDKKIAEFELVSCI